MKAELELRNTRLLQFIVDDRYRILRHSVLLLVSLLVLFFTNWQTEYHGSFKYLRIICVYGLLISICYINMFILVPRFFFRGSYIVYLILLSLVVLLFLLLTNALMDKMIGPERMSAMESRDIGARGFFEGFIIVIPIVLVTTMIKLFQRWTRDNGRIAELKNIALRTELNELKNQINPHFLFNMLNGIKALIRTDPHKATLIIMKLSEFLRYQIYENNEEKTLIKSEINFLSNFLNLEKIRRDNLLVEINFPENSGVLNGLFVPPNLFTTFVENAVKHSIDTTGAESNIIINFSLVENKLHFSCINSKDPFFTATDKKNSGLGLANIKRRLALMYDQQHKLDIKSSNNQFSVSLKIPL